MINQVKKIHGISASFFFFALAALFMAQEVYAQKDTSSFVETEEIPYLPDDMIEDRLKCLESDITLTYNETIRGFIDYFSVRNRDYIRVMEQKKNLYFPIFEEYLAKHNMPDELKYLSIVESGLNPKAISPAGAGGLWQFMPSTGRIFKLNQDYYIDERFDPYKSTEAACLYLNQLYRMFDDWQMALAAYNCGPGNVRKAIRRSGYRKSFWEVYRYLPRETRSYVPQFIAVMYIMNNTELHNLNVEDIEYPASYDTLMVNGTFDLKKFCEYNNLCEEDILDLNPALKTTVVPEYLKYPVRLPADVVENIRSDEKLICYLDSCVIVDEATLAKIQDNREPPKVYYRVRRGDYLGKIANRYNTSVYNIKRWNNIRGNVIQPGQTLVIYTRTYSGAYASSSSGSSSSSSSSSSSGSRSGSKMSYTVRSGDYLGKIASSYGVTVSDIREWNNLSSSVIAPGQRLTLYPGSSGSFHYTVQSGDNLSKIASAYNVSVADLRAWNNLNGSVIHVGQKLKINGSGPAYYHVQPGDTLWTISQKYKHLSVEDIKRKNNLRSDNIQPGMKLII